MIIAAEKGMSYNPIIIMSVLQWPVVHDNFQSWFSPFYEYERSSLEKEREGERDKEREREKEREKEKEREGEKL